MTTSFVWVDRGHQGVVQDLLAAGVADGDLVGGVVEPVFPLELGRDRLLQRRCPVHGGVFGIARVDGADRRLLDRVRGVEIRLARAEADDVAAGGLQLTRLVCHRNRRRRLDPGQGLGKERHGCGLVRWGFKRSGSKRTGP